MIYSTLLELVLPDWNYWNSEPPVTVKRTVLNSDFTLYTDLACVVQGVRRCGKSTLLAQMMQHLELDPNHCFFINFEDPRFSDALDSSLLDSLVKYADDRVGSSEPRYFFLDEIHEVQDWEKWLRLKLDRPAGDRFVITGSNASLLGGDLGTALTGRHISVELFPFSFPEFASLFPDADIKMFLDRGGFPRPLMMESGAALLRQYFTDIIERDVRRHVAARSSLTLTQLVRAVYESCGSELSVRSLARQLDISPDTVSTYLDATQRAYLILACPYFSFSERKRAVRNRKFYPVDNGLRDAVVTRTGKDLGKRLETAVYHCLRNRYESVYYWRGQGEVDFVVQTGSEITPVQVSWDGIKDRHKQALGEFYTEHKQAKDALFITSANALDFFNASISFEAL